MILLLASNPYPAALVTESGDGLGPGTGTLDVIDGVPVRLTTVFRSTTDRPSEALDLQIRDLDASVPEPPPSN
jgi:hypothetical protein